MAEKVHETPTHLETWVELAVDAIGIEREQIEKVGMIDSGEEGKYAARRVWFYPRHGVEGFAGYLRSVKVAARDEIKTDEIEAGDYVDAEGTLWAPYTIWGCEPCSTDCDRHGHDALTAVAIDDGDEGEPEDPLEDAPGQTIEDAILSLVEPGELYGWDMLIGEALRRWPEISRNDWATALERLEADGFLVEDEGQLRRPRSAEGV